MMTRFDEIKQEKLELRKALEAPDCNLADIESKLNELEAEEAEIRKKQEICDKLNAGEISGKTIEERKENVEMENKFESMEYRKAFAAHVTAGKAIPEEFRAAMNAAGASAVIPTTVQNRIVELMEGYGGLYAEVSHTAYPAGMTIPTASVLPTAEWVAESATTADKSKTYGSVVFAGNKLRVQVSVSLELSVSAIEAFEANLAQSVANAMLKAFDLAIVNGSGVGCPKGILKETARATVSLDKLNYAKICEIEGAIPSAYDSNAVYVMAKSTLFALKSMRDNTAGAAIAIETVDGKPQYSLLGRRVVISPAMPDYASAGAGDVVAFAMDLSQYVMNFNYDVKISKREDWETEDQQVKAVAIADGKTVDANGLVFVAKA